MLFTPALPAPGHWCFVPVIRKHLALACLVFLWSAAAWAHDPTKSYLNLILATNQLTGQWDIPITELQKVVALDADTNGVITWKKLREHLPAVNAYAREKLKLAFDGQPVAIPFNSTEPDVTEFADGTYLELSFAVTNVSRPKTIEVDYRLFFETNSLHRGLLRFEAAGKVQSAVFSPGQERRSFRVEGGDAWREFWLFLKEGVSHIWTGYDHILFLLALLLPSVLQRELNGWRGVAAFRPAFIQVLKIVTAFTVAHSLTLSLAALQIVRLPSRLTESAIALSVMLAALNNLRPMVRERGWLVAFVFGLVHGFGFANALSELGLGGGGLLAVLAGFNLGVETGQLAIVAVFLPVAFALRRSWFYQIPVLRMGSTVIILIASTWFVERVANVKWLPF